MTDDEAMTTLARWGFPALVAALSFAAGWVVNDRLGATTDSTRYSDIEHERLIDACMGGLPANMQGLCTSMVADADAEGVPYEVMLDNLVELHRRIAD